MTTLSFQISSDKIAGRIDPYYYQNKFDSILRELRRSKWQLSSLDEIASVVCGSTPKEGSRLVSPDHGAKFLKTANVQDFELDLSTQYYITREAHERRAISALKANDILLNIIGATLDVVGRVAITPSGIAPANINQNIARIRMIDPERVSPLYLMGFLGTKLAQLQIEKLSRQAGQVNLNTAEVSSILVPIPPKGIQSQVAEIVRDVCLLRDKNRKDIQELVRNFEDEIPRRLGINIDGKRSLVFTSSNKSISRRMDAEYYQPAYLNLESQLQGVSEHLAEIADFPSESIDPRRTPEKEFHYVEIENLDELNGSITGYQNIIGSEAPSRARLLIRTGDIIIPSLRGSFKKIAIVSPQFNDCLATTGFLLVHPTHIDATGLFGVLRSKVGQMQLERAVTGAIMPALTRSELENVLIPATSKERSFSSYVDQFLSSIRDLQRVSSTIIANAKSEIQDCILGN